MKSISDYESIHTVNPLYLIVGTVDAYNKEISTIKYLVFVSTDQIKNCWLNTQNFGMGLKVLKKAKW